MPTVDAGIGRAGRSDTPNDGHHLVNGDADRPRINPPSEERPVPMFQPSGRASTAEKSPHIGSVEIRGQNWTRNMRDYMSFIIVGVIFPISSFAGLAALMRTGRKMTWRSIFSSMLNSGLLGVAIACGMIHAFGPEHKFFIGFVSLMAGLGGNTAVEFGYGLFSKALRAYAEKYL